jgi:hypothetical protein
VNNKSNANNKPFSFIIQQGSEVVRKKTNSYKKKYVVDYPVNEIVWCITGNSNK